MFYSGLQLNSQPALVNLQIQMLIPPRNTLTETFRMIFNKLILFKRKKPSSTLWSQLIARPSIYPGT